jgi:transcriptional regulator with XRE-family HTH domain
MESKKSNLIKAARVYAGYTQERLAKKIGCPRSYISLWENGRIGEARLSDVIRLCDLINIDIQTIVKEAKQLKF